MKEEELATKQRRGQKSGAQGPPQGSQPAGAVTAGRRRINRWPRQCSVRLGWGTSVTPTAGAR